MKKLYNTVKPTISKSMAIIYNKDIDDIYTSSDFVEEGDDYFKILDKPSGLLSVYGMGGGASTNKNLLISFKIKCLEEIETKTINIINKLKAGIDKHKENYPEYHL